MSSTWAWSRIRANSASRVASVRRYLTDNLEGLDLHALAAAVQRIAAQGTAGGDACLPEPPCD